MTLKGGPGLARLLQLEGVGRGDIVWVALMSLMLVTLLLPVASYVAALSPIQSEWGLNNTQAGSLYSVSLAGYAVSALLLVPLTDRLPPARILQASAVLMVAVHILFPLVAEGLASGAALRALTGVGFLGVYVPGLRIISQRFSAGGRGTGMGLFVTAQYTANSVSLAVTGALMARLEWRDAYLVVSLLSLAGLPMAYLLLRSGHHVVPGSTGRLNLAVLRNFAARYLILGYSLHAVVLFAVRVWLPGFLAVVMVARGEDVVRAAVTGATVGGAVLLVGSAGPFIGGVISERWGRAASASGILAVSAACSFALGWSGDVIGWTGVVSWTLIVVVGVLYGWAIAADSAIYQTGVTEAAEPGDLGSTMAAQAFLGLVAGVLGPVVFGGVLDLFSEELRWAAGFSALGLISLVGSAAMQRLRWLPRAEVRQGG